MFREFYIGGWKAMLWIKSNPQKPVEKVNPPGIYDGKISIRSEINYQLLVDTLKSEALINLYEDMTGIKVPDKYRKGL